VVTHNLEEGEDSSGLGLIERTHIDANQRMSFDLSSHHCRRLASVKSSQELCRTLVQFFEYVKPKRATRKYTRVRQATVAVPRIPGKKLNFIRAKKPRMSRPPE
jgi:hypothetical protein